MLSTLKSFSLKKTLFISAIASLVLDVVSSLYFVEYWKVQNLSERFLSLALFAQGGSISELDPHFLDELRTMIENTAGFMLMIFLVINGVFYAYLTQEKKWAWQYVVTYTASASLFCLVTAIEAPKVGTFFTTYNILAIGLYAFLAYVLWMRKAEVQESGFKWKSSE